MPIRKYLDIENKPQREFDQELIRLCGGAIIGRSASARKWAPAYEIDRVAYRRWHRAVRTSK